MDILNKVCKIVAGLAIVFSSIGVAQAQNVDTAFITSLTGKATIENQGIEYATAFTRVRFGSVLKLDSNAKIQVVYIDNGRQETWSGGSQFKIGGTKSEAITGSPSKVSKLPPSLARSLMRTPDSKVSGRVGMVRVRALDYNLLYSQEAKKFKQVKQAQSQGSYAADLYWLNFLVECYECKRIERNVAKLQSKNPNSSEAKEISNRYLMEVAAIKLRNECK